MNSPRAAKGKKPGYFTDPATDKLLQMVVTLAGEVSVLRDRLDLVERLATETSTFDKANLETMHLTADATAERSTSRADFVARVLRVLHQDLAEITNPDVRGFDDLVKTLGSTQ
jgi:hypothetical protein